MGWKFWEKESEKGEPSKPKMQKLPRPKDIPEPVGRYLVVNLGKDPDWVWRLKGVVRPRQESKDSFDVRVFDEVKTAQGRVTVKDYTSLDGHPECILYEGWFDKKSMKVQIEEKKMPPLPRAA
jgi:hypothetical protein